MTSQPKKSLAMKFYDQPLLTVRGGNFHYHKDNLYDCKVVIRDYELMRLMEELRHVVNDTAIPIRGYQSKYIEMPVIDMDAMLEYLFSDLDKVLAGQTTCQTLVHQYVLMEILDHDAEYTPLIDGVAKIVTRIMQICVDHIEHLSLDSYVQFKYELQRTLASNGVVLRRIHQTTGHL